MTLLHERRLEVLIFLFVLGLHGWFYNGHGWNQNARYDPIWAFVEPGPHQHTLQIDDFVYDPEARLNTGDYARNAEHDPHYYSNKAPGSSLLGIPLYWALYHAERLTGHDPRSVRGVLVNAYLINLWVTVLPMALSAVLFFHLAAAFTHRGRALFLTLLLYGGTLFFPFSTALWGHTTAAAFGVAALACFVRRGRRAAFLTGLFAGVAVLCDYGAAPLAVSLAATTVLFRARRSDSGALAAGAAGPAVAFLLYHELLFGSPFRLASSYSTPDLLVERDVLGMFGPVDPGALWGLTFSTVRGIFFFMPALLLALVAVRKVSDAEQDRPLWWVALVNIAAVLVINASYNTWQGGLSAGARYQIIALPFYVLLLALLPDTRRSRIALYALAAVSFANMFVIAAVSPMAPDAWHGSPLFFAWHKLWGVLLIDLGLEPAPIGGSLSRGSIHVYPLIPMRSGWVPLDDSVLGRWATFNLGERLLGLGGTASLLPAVLGFGALGAWMTRIARSEPDVSRPTASPSPGP